MSVASLSADLLRTVLRSDALDVSSEAEALDVLISWVREQRRPASSSTPAHDSSVSFGLVNRKQHIVQCRCRICPQAKADPSARAEAFASLIVELRLATLSDKAISAALSDPFVASCPRLPGILRAAVSCRVAFRG